MQNPHSPSTAHCAHGYRGCGLSVYGTHQPSHLGDDGDFEAQAVQANLSNVHPIDDDVATCRLIDPEQTQGERRLPSSCTAHNTNLQDRKGLW